MNKETLVCRCNDVTVNDIEQALFADMYLSVEEIAKKFKIGSKCNACTNPSSNRVEVNFVDVVEKFKKENL